MYYNYNFSLEISAKDNFRINTFYVILDRLATDLSNRRKAYETFCKPFDFIIKLHEFKNSEIKVKANDQCCTYKSDLKKYELINELLHFRSHQIKCFNEKKITPLQLLQVIHGHNMKDLYPNIEIALRIFVSIPATNCSAERLFLVLKRMKSYLRSTMLQVRLHSLTILTVNNDLTSSLTYVNNNCKRLALKPLIKLLIKLSFSF